MNTPPDIDPRLIEYLRKRGYLVVPLHIETARQSEANALLLAVARQSGISVEDLVGAARFHDLTRPRHLGMYFAHKHLGWTKSKCSRVFQRDHKTVLFGINKITAHLADEETAEEFREEIAAIGELFDHLWRDRASLFGPQPVNLRAVG